MDYMKTLEDKAFDLAIVDPPYGINVCKKMAKERRTPKWKKATIPNYKNFDDSSPPDFNYFRELQRVSKNQIIWGANHFAINFNATSSGWIVWYKKRFDEKNNYSDAELAFSSFNKGCRLFHLPWIGFGAINVGEKRIHPTQKPVKLYDWLLANYAKEGDKILDTHLGSGSSAIAAHYAGYDFVGCELDKDYFEAAKKRFDEETRQEELCL